MFGKKNNYNFEKIREILATEFPDLFADISARTIESWCYGLKRPTFERCICLAEFLNIPLKDFLFEYKKYAEARRTKRTSRRFIPSESEIQTGP